MIVCQTVHGELKIIWNSLEEESKNTIGEFGWLFAVWSNTVDDMHLEVEKLSIDGVLRWSMEVILKTLQLDTITLLVKQANGGSFQVVVIVCLVLHDKLVLAAFLVIF